MPEDPIAHSELSALARRYEDTAQKTDREFGIVKSDLTARADDGMRDGRDRPGRGEGR